MTSYYDNSKKPFSPADNCDNMSTNTPTDKEATERTPLLSAPKRSYFLESVGVQVSNPQLRPQSFRDDDDARTIVNLGDEPEGLMPILSKVTSNAPLGIEAGAVPATSNSPDEHGDFRLPQMDDLRVRRGPEFSADEEAYVPGAGISPGKFWVIFAGLMVSVFVAAFDSTIMASTHTSITSAFHASELASWLSTSFLLTSTSFQPLYGRVSDVTGRKIPYIFACTVFTLATIWCALAQSIESFIAARAVCGLGAGGMLTMGSIVLSDMLPIEIRGTYQSINNLFYGFGSALGAALGGFLADMLGWRWEFGIQVPFGVFCMIVCCFTIPDRASPRMPGKKKKMTMWQRFSDFDWSGSVYLSTSVAFIILGMNLGGNVLPWSDPRVVGSLILGFLLANLLVKTEKKAKSPVLPLDLLASSPRGNLVWNGFMGMLTVNSIIFNMPLYFQAVLLESATKAGGRLLIPSIAGTVGAVSTGLIITRTRRLDYTLYAGATILLFGAISLLFIKPNMSNLGIFLMLIPCNLGLGLGLPSGLMSILATSPITEQAVTTSTLIMMRSLGSVLGVATSSLIVQNFLLYYLKLNVTGPGKDEIIEKVRRSVVYVFDLEKVHQAQVMLSYESALYYCFIFSVLTAFITFALIFKIKLPTLRTKGEAGNLKDSSHAGIAE